MNPLDGTDVPFALSLMNPNPTSGRNKGGAWYRVAFEVDADTFHQFQAAKSLAGMVIECQGMVAALNAPMKQTVSPQGSATVKDGVIEVDGRGPYLPADEGPGNGDPTGANLTYETPNGRGNFLAGAVLKEALAPVTASPVMESARHSMGMAPASAGMLLAQHLHKTGYFNSVELWNKIEAKGWYTQAGHVRYIESLPCLFAPENVRKYKSIASGRNFACEPFYSEETGELRSIGHHCQSAALPSKGGGGKGSRKVPDWYRVPFCNGHHTNWAHGSSKTSASRADKELLIVIAVGFMAEIAERVMKEVLGLESLNELTEDLYGTWIEMLDEPKD